MNKEAIIRKLTSRKLWMAIALFVSGVLTAAGKETVAETISGLIIQAAAVIGYIVGEGLVDASNKDAICLDGVTLDGVADVEEGSENG